MRSFICVVSRHKLGVPQLLSGRWRS